MFSFDARIWFSLPERVDIVAPEPHLLSQQPDMTYEYLCKACGHHFEAEQSISEAPLTDCPKCGQAEAKRQISRGGGFILKGGGWYSDLYSSSSASSSSSTESSPSGSKSGSSSASSAGSGPSTPSTSSGSSSE